MTEPRKDERKRDRAAYMRDYRKRRAVDRPTLTNLAARIVELEAQIDTLHRAASIESGAYRRLLADHQPATERK